MKLGAFGVLAHDLPSILFPVGQQHVSSGVAAIINALTPLTTIVVSQLWPSGERAAPGKAGRCRGRL